MTNRNGNSEGPAPSATNHPSGGPADSTKDDRDPVVDPHPTDDLDAQVVELVLDELDDDQGDKGHPASGRAGGTIHALVTGQPEVPDVYDYDEELDEDVIDALGASELAAWDDEGWFDDDPERSVGSVGSAGSVASVRSAGSVASTHSVGSVASGFSAGSIASAFSAGSIVSLSSVGSLASILSIGSFRSILSIGSRNSILSIGADGGFLTIGRGPNARSPFRR